MGNYSSQLQEAILAALRADSILVAKLGGAKIFDYVPSRVKPPYIAFGAMNLQEWNTASENGIEFFFDLHCWSKFKGREECYLLDADLKRILDNQNLPLQSYNLIQLQWQFSQIEYDEEARAYFGASRFRAILEI